MSDSNDVSIINYVRVNEALYTYDLNVYISLNSRLRSLFIYY